LTFQSPFDETFNRNNSIASAARSLFQDFLEVATDSNQVGRNLTIRKAGPVTSFSLNGFVITLCV
jgi:hypothetical protein